MPETVKISGKQHQIQTRNEVLDLDDIEGHQIGMWENKAINFKGNAIALDITFMEWEGELTKWGLENK